MSRRRKSRKSTSRSGSSSKKKGSSASSGDAKKKAGRRRAEAPAASVPAGPVETTPLSWRRILLMALAAGVWTGLVESVPAMVAPYGHVVIRLSRDFVWMTPLGDVVYFFIAAGILLALGHWWPRAKTRPVVFGTMAGMAALCLGLLPDKLEAWGMSILAVGVGVQAWRMARRPPRWPWVTGGSALVGVFLVAWMTGQMEWHRWVQRKYWMDRLPAATAHAPNILLIIMDTVRGASLRFIDPSGEASDFPPARTPALDSLADHSALFTDAIAAAPWTLPSHASMFTGAWPTVLWPGHHLEDEWRRALNARHPVVAGAFDRHGYVTGGFVGNLAFTVAATGLARGFLYYEDYPLSVGQTILSTSVGRRLAGSNWLRHVTGYHQLLNRKTAADVTNEFLRWERGHAGDGHPWFVFINYFDAHEPYFPPDSVKRAMPKGSHWDNFTHFAGLLHGNGAYILHKWEMDPAERRAHAAGYNAGISAEDRQIGRIVDVLKAWGVLDNTVIVVASDHGEQLGEHGLYNHANSVYRQTIHVPLLVYDPRPGHHVTMRVDEVVSLRDVGATLLTLAGVNPAREGIGGHSLTRFWAPADSSSPLAQGSDDTVFTSLSRGADREAWYPVNWGPSMFALRDSTYHYIRNGDGTEQLYQWDRDTAEVHNLAGEPQMAPVLEKFRTMLSSLVSYAHPVPGQPVEHPKAPPRVKQH